MGRLCENVPGCHSHYRPLTVISSSVGVAPVVLTSTRVHLSCCNKTYLLTYVLSCCSRMSVWQAEFKESITEHVTHCNKVPRCNLLDCMFTYLENPWQSFGTSGTHRLWQLNLQSANKRHAKIFHRHTISAILMLSHLYFSSISAKRSNTTHTSIS